MGRVLVSFVGLLLAAGFACAGQEPKKESFWDKLQSKVEKVAPRKKEPAIAAVSGVRGEKKEAAGDLYWKGKERPLAVEEGELEKFKVALGAAVAGKRDAAVGYFEEFLRQYPASRLRDDALSAMKQLKGAK